MRTASRREAGVEDGPSLVRTASGREAGAEEPNPLLRTTSGREAGAEEPSPLLRTASVREAEDGHRKGEGGGAPWIGEVGAGRRGGGT